jgi:hypothetical protein
MPEPAPIPETRYRIVCYEIEAGQETVILDATAHAFIAIAGTIDEHNTMTGQGTTPGRYRSYDGSPASSPTTNASPTDTSTPSRQTR